MLRIKAAIVLLFLFLAGSLAWGTSLERGVSPALEKENDPKFVELYRIRIENRVGGTIEVSTDKGQNWETAGAVLYPTLSVNKNGFAAAKYLGEGKVAASAVNAIHIKTGAADWSRAIFSILPKEFLLPPKHYRSFFSPNSSIYTNIPGGTSIFGGGHAPFVGNPVKLLQAGAPLSLMPRDHVPKLGDVYYIIVNRPEEVPKEIVLENRFGGRIVVHYFSGAEKIIGEVLKPVVGVGRFEGSMFCDPGRIRANHPGVIDVSLAPMGSVGGFQIVPALHGMDMGYVKKMTQWMVIGPSRAEDPSLEGVAPFFKYFLHPSYTSKDLNGENWRDRLLDRFLVEVVYEGESEWKPMPIFAMSRTAPLPEWANAALEKVSHFRVLFPIYDTETLN